jgi:hypothetical protein
LSILPAGSDDAIVCAKGQATQPLSRFAAECLARCDTFRTLTEHSMVIARELRLGVAEQTDIHRALQAAAETGLLMPLTAITGWSDSSWLDSGRLDSGRLDSGRLDVGRLDVGRQDITQQGATQQGATRQGATRQGATQQGATRQGAPRQSDGSADTVEAVVMVSANRVDSARRALQGFMDNARRHGRQPEWLLYDDSADPAVGMAYQDMLADLGSKVGTPIGYAGQQRKRAYADALIAMGLPADTVDFCFFGQPGLGTRYGCNRNAMLLDTAGRLVLSLDDDVICELGSLGGDPSCFAGEPNGISGGPGGVSCGPDGNPGEPGGHPGKAGGVSRVPGGILGHMDLVRTASGDHTEFHYFGSVAQARAAVHHHDWDYLALHERFLTRSAVECLASGGSVTAAQLDDAGDRLVRLLAMGMTRVAVTQMGIAGDSGMGSTFYYLLAQGASRERLLVDEATYQACLHSRALVRRAAGPILCDNPAFMNYAAGFDCRQLLPPYMPMLRNSDGLFGTMLPLLQPDLLFALLPWTVGHEPPEPRQSDVAARLRNATGLSTSDYIALLCRTWPSAWLAGLSVDERFRSLGRYLMELGSLPHGELSDQLVSIHAREKARLLAFLDQLLLDAGGKPDFWARDVQSTIDAIHDSLPRADSALPADMSGTDSAARLAAFSDYIRRYGALLAVWPDMIAAAHTLRERGVRLAVTTDRPS